jgi:hypothetical protein
LPFELDVAAPEMIRRQNVDADALAATLGPAIEKAEPRQARR